MFLDLTDAEKALLGGPESLKPLPDQATKAMSAWHRFRPIPCRRKLAGAPNQLRYTGFEIVASRASRIRSWVTSISNSANEDRRSNACVSFAESPSSGDMFTVKATSCLWRRRPTIASIQDDFRRSPIHLHRPRKRPMQGLLRASSFGQPLRPSANGSGPSLKRLGYRRSSLRD